MNTFRYDGPSQNSLTTGGSGLASASLALTIMLAVSACSTPPYPRKLLSEIRAEDAVNQFSLLTKPPVAQPQVLETAAGPIVEVPLSDQPTDLEIASAEPPQADMTLVGAGPEAEDLDIPGIVSSGPWVQEIPAATAAAEPMTDDGRMTVVAAETPPAALLVAAAIDEEPQADEAIVTATPEAPNAFTSPTNITPAAITDQPSAGAWVDPDLTEDTSSSQAVTAPTGAIETGATETGPAPLDAAIRPEPAFDIATLDPVANRRFEPTPLPERDLPTADTTVADTAITNTTVAEEATTDLPAPPEASLEVAALDAASNPGLVTEPYALPLPAPKAPSLRREPKAMHQKQRSIPGEGGLIELERAEARGAPARPTPALVSPAVTAAADPLADDAVTDAEDAPQIAGSRAMPPQPLVPETEISAEDETSADDRGQEQDPEPALPALAVADVERRTVVAIPSDAPQLASTTANLPRAIEPLAPLTGLQVPFEPGSSALSEEARSSLADLAQQLDVASSPRLRLSAFAAAGDLSNGQSRRLSLSRLFSVRDFLIEQGLRSEDIDLMPMAGAEDETPIDRVELEIDRT